MIAAWVELPALDPLATPISPHKFPPLRCARRCHADLMRFSFIRNRQYLPCTFRTSV